MDITGCPQAIRKRECCIGCEAILSRLTYSEEELGLQKKSMALVLVDVFHIRNFRKERNLKKKKPIKFSISKLEKDLFFKKNSNSIEIFISCYLIIKCMFIILIEFNVSAVFKIL